MVVVVIDIHENCTSLVFYEACSKLTFYMVAVDDLDRNRKTSKNRTITLTLKRSLLFWIMTL